MARRFQFSLQTLLRVRELAEREAGRRVGAKQAEIARLDRLNAEAFESIATQHRQLANEQQAAQLDPQDLARSRAWIAHLRRTIAERQSIRANLQQELGALQSKLVEARKQSKTIEKLRERRHEAHRRDTQRKAQYEAEELAQQLHGRAQTTPR